VAAGTPVILDTTHARRPWRLLYTQPLELPAPVIREFHAAIEHRQFGPCRAEGFAAIVALNAAAGEADADALRTCLGELAERAAAYLARWSEVHGDNSDVYGDVDAIHGDLAWLEANGFTRLDWSSEGPIDPAPFREPAGGGVNGGTPSLAGALVFRRVFTLLRHILREPFDAPSGQAPADGVPLYRHLIDRLTPIEGSYKPDQEAVLRNDLRHLLRPYGFSPEIKGRPDSLRQGYAIGTALLSADQLLGVHSLLKASMERLSDASQKPLLLALEDRLRRSGLLDAKAGRKLYGRRALAHRSFTKERSGTLAAREPSERIEQAIQDRRRVWLRHLPDPVTAAQRQRGDDGRFSAWPLQLLFHNISWYLAFEHDAIGTREGLIRTLRVYRLVLLGNDGAW